VVTQLPNGIFVGERTYGATGPLAPNSFYHDGSFNVGDFLKVQTSSAAFKGLDERIYENTGFTPNILVSYDKASLANGIDGQLEKAISLMH